VCAVVGPRTRDHETRKTISSTLARIIIKRSAKNDNTQIMRKRETGLQLPTSDVCATSSANARVLCTEARSSR